MSNIQIGQIDADQMDSDEDLLARAIRISFSQMSDESLPRLTAVVTNSQTHRESDNVEDVPVVRRKYTIQEITLEESDDENDDCEIEVLQVKRNQIVIEEVELSGDEEVDDVDSEDDVEFLAEVPYSPPPPRMPWTKLAAAESPDPKSEIDWFNEDDEEEEEQEEVDDEERHLEADETRAKKMEENLARAEREQSEAQNVVAELEDRIDEEEEELRGRMREELDNQAELRMAAVLRVNVGTAVERQRLIASAKHQCESSLQRHREELKKAKELVEVKREARLEATMAVDEDSYLQSRHFSRQCLICLCPNPYRRAVMVKCGHITCTSCAERLGTEENIEFACPFCRTPTTYMKMFEESDTQLARLRAEKQTRKRKRDPQMDSDSSDVDISSDVSIGSPDRPLSSLSSSSSSDSAEDNVEVEEEAEPPSTAYVNPPSQDHDYAGAATASETDDRRAMDERLERTEREEREAEEEFRERRRRFNLREEEMRRDMMVKTLREKKHRDAIESMREEIRRREESIREMWDERIESERVLEDERDALDQAKAWAAMKREARRKAMKEADEHPFSQTLRYSRGCAICLTANPRRRAVMIKCGHMTCLLCAEQLVEASSRRFPCPFCRKRTKYVKTFENVDAPQVRQAETEIAKRKLADDESGPSQLKLPVVSKRKRFTIHRFVLNQRNISRSL
ncbi:hypothetical protein PRIPAC_89977 [Pristionchus pacificus]|uniref:Zinc finger protein n=1 Tax=Pristionchus pacificus TaxID=54126 RepID=A0A2A6CY83_PRIPA|nr:hypothetical protein PRIPAC_89977 [Pristionchus pacificus]|eukprot:PDM83172.1 zinc finger protein [Pristionchus pacificus]